MSNIRALSEELAGITAQLLSMSSTLATLNGPPDTAAIVGRVQDTLGELLAVVAHAALHSVTPPEAADLYEGRAFRAYRERFVALMKDEALRTGQGRALAAIEPALLLLARLRP